MRTHTRLPRARHRERGVALAVSMFALATLAMASAVGLHVGSSGTQATRNYRGATRIHFTAESAISEALQVINGPGVVHLENDVVTPWAAIYGSGTRPFAPHAGYSYSVTPVATPGDEANSGRLIAMADGPEGVHNVVVANVIRSDVPSTAPGAIYLAADDPTDAEFQGNAFLVDGNDTNYTGGPGPGIPVPGISTRNDTNTQEAIASLSSGQKDNVQGLGYSSGPPTIPSINTSPAAPTQTQLSQIIDDLLARPGVVEYTSNKINGSAVFGTEAAPQITYFSNASGVDIKANGNAEGAGILIVEGDLTIQGNIEFKGLILVRGRTNVVGDTSVTGNATVYGSLWTNDINMNVGGSAIVSYSTQALALANQVGGGGALPSPLLVRSLADCAQLDAGVGGCP